MNGKKYKYKELRNAEMYPLYIGNKVLFDIPKSDSNRFCLGTIVKYFKENSELIEMIKKLDINTKYIGEGSSFNEFITDKKFVITGTIEGLSRDEIKLFIENNGGTTSESVSKNTDIVIVGVNPGSKYQKAIELNKMIWDEKKLKEVMNLK